VNTGVTYIMNIYKPELVRIVDIIEETPDIRTFRLEFQDKEYQKNFSFLAGQFAEYSVYSFRANALRLP